MITSLFFIHTSNEEISSKMLNNLEVNASELPEIFEEMFPQYYLHK